MSKQIKSVRFNDDILQVFEEYSSLSKELFGTKISFGSFVNEAVAKLLYEISDGWASAMENDSLVEVQPNGKIKKLVFTEDQIKAAKNHLDSAFSAYYPYLGISDDEGES